MIENLPSMGKALSSISCTVNTHFLHKIYKSSNIENHHILFMSKQGGNNFHFKVSLFITRRKVVFFPNIPGKALISRDRVFNLTR